ncbi:MAG TPA: hypothetical protein VKS60_00805 [Stellaceae bacterium]|nr:hypothetical protein [Stellaceae bacterium]
MTLPTPHELKAALWVARTLPEGGLSPDDARASYALAPSGGLYRTEDLAAAEARLSACGLVKRSGDRLKPSQELLELRTLPISEAAEVLLVAISERDPPLWLSAVGDDIELAVEIIPDGDLRTFEAIISEPERREAILLALGRKVASAEAADQGADGENYVVAVCRARLVALGREDLARGVRRVSLLSDQLGYDVVSPTVQGAAWRLEVKAARMTGYFVRVTLTRNEARVGLGDAGWALVVCALRPDETLEILGWCSGATLAALLPQDVPRGRWETARLTLLGEELRDGLPDLELGWTA